MSVWNAFRGINAAQSIFYLWLEPIKEKMSFEQVYLPSKHNFWCCLMQLYLLDFVDSYLKLFTILYEDYPSISHWGFKLTTSELWVSSHNQKPVILAKKIQFLTYFLTFWSSLFDWLSTLSLAKCFIFV